MATANGKKFVYLVSCLLFVAAMGCFSGSGCLPRGRPGDLRPTIETAIRARAPNLSEEAIKAQTDEAVAIAAGGNVPGSGLPALAWVQSLITQSMLIFAIGAFLRWSQWARVSVVLTLIYSIALLVAGIITLIGSIALLLLMVGLFLAAPFGTIAYIALYGFFPVASSSSLLGMGFFLDLVGGVVLIVGNPRILAAKKVMGSFFSVLVCCLILSFLHRWVPGLFVSIADAIGAIVLAVVMIVWAVILLITSLLGLRTFLPR